MSPEENVRCGSAWLRLKTNDRSQRNIPMLLRRILVPLPLQHGQRLNQFLPRLPRLDDRVHEPTIRRDIRIREPITELLNLLAPHFLPIRRRVQLALVDNIHRAFRSEEHTSEL